MSGNTLFKWGKYAVTGMLCVAGLAWAQPMSNEMAQGIYDAEVRKRRAQQQQGASRGPSAAEVRAWHERERKVQAEIAELRATPFYMALAFDAANNRIIPRGGFYTEKRAVEEASKQCQSANCRVFATFANACGVLTFPERGVQSVSDLFIGVDTDDSRAAAKSIQMCEAKHGHGKCLYSSVKTKNGTAFCTGYDYSIYGHR